MSGVGRALAALLLVTLAARAEDEVVVLRGRVLTAEGAPIEDGAVVVRGRTLASVGPWSAPPEGAKVVALPGAVITPGLIDAAATVGVASAGSWAEQASEVVCETRVLDELDLGAEAWGRLCRRGVTLVHVPGSPESVVGGRGAVVRTAGPAAERVVAPEASVKVTLGPEAWRRGARNHGPGGAIDVLVRRPTTRMGAVWVVRDAFARARAGEAGPALDVLRRVVAGQVPLRVQARTRGDLETALRLTAEAGVDAFALEEATEVRFVLDLVAARPVTVIYGPIFDRPRGFRAKTGEADDPALDTPRLLEARHVPWCLTAADREGEDDLGGQLVQAVRWGLEPAAALRAATLAPARLLGLGERTGSLAPGKDADVVVWSGEPWEATSRPLLVLIGGRVVHGALGPPAPAAAAPEAPPPSPPHRFSPQESQ